MKKSALNMEEKRHFSRREFIFLSAITGGAALILPSFKGASENLSKRHEEHLLDLIGDALFPKDDYIPYSPSELKISSGILKGLDMLHPSLKREFLLAVKAVEVFPILDFKWKRFSSMTPEERVRYINSWSESRMFLKRKIFVALKSAIAFAYFSHKSVWKYIGYDGPWVGRNGEE